MRRTKSLLAPVCALSLLLGACASGTTLDDPLPSGTAPPPRSIQTAAALVQFDACEDFLDHVISRAVDLVGPYGLDGNPIVWFEDGRALGAEETAEGGDDGAATPDFSETNVQVEGVDEPDIVKTDGERIVVMAQGELIVVDVSGEDPVETGRLATDGLSVQSLFLSGDKVVIFGSVWTHHPIPLAEPDRGIAPPQVVTPTVEIVEVDIEGSPEIIRTMTIDGAFVSGRMVDESVRLVLTSGPVGFEWSYPEGSGLKAEREAVERNREIVRNSSEENWIPYYVVADAEGEVTDEGTLFECDRASHPEEFAGLDMLSVLTIDLSDGLEVSDATGVLASGDTIYASEDSLYVATQDWQNWRWLETQEDSDRPDGPTTEIHKFDIRDPGSTEYVASGEVDGYLLNQFAMDEHEGMLRVASTTTPNWWGSGPDSQSRITVLREIGDALVGIGRVDGLGKTEQIYAVRFMGDVGYVVTFRQTDPLYTVDLSDPRDPEVLGELKIPGYSAYLHPIGEGLMMGVGQDATDEGMVLGTQVSTFDVSDLSDPVRLDTHTLGEEASSQVEYDHHAFLYWQGLAMIPIQQWSWDGKSEEVFVGAIGLEVGEDGSLAELGEITHPGGRDQNWDGRSQILRSLVIGDSVYTISTGGLLKSALRDLDAQAWLEF